MASRVQFGAFLVFALLAVAVTAQAQAIAPPDATTWRRGTTLNVFAGLARASGDSAPLAGGALGWEITPWIGLEATGTWLEWGHRAHGFGAAMRALVPLRASRSVAPFLAGGVGVHRAWFQAADTAMPEFYRRRISQDPTAVGVTATFTDPSIVAGGGVNIFLTRQIAIRPEMDWTIVLRDSRTRTVPTAQVHLAYHFEDHPITSTRAAGARR